MRRSLVVSLALLAIVRAPAVAQTCQGLASFSTGQMQVAGNAAFNTAYNSWGGSFSYGLPSGAFGGANISTTSFDGINSSSLGLGANVGYQMTMGQAAKIHLCPVASFSIGTGPDDAATNLNSSSRDLNVGFAVGTTMGTNSQLRILPTAGLALAYTKVKAENTATNTVAEASDTYGLARLGVGFVFNQNISVRPTIDIPLGYVTNDATFGVSVAYNFGNKGIGKAPRRH